MEQAREAPKKPDVFWINCALNRLWDAPATQFVSVELTYRDGSLSKIKSFRR